MPHTEQESEPIDKYSHKLVERVVNTVTFEEDDKAHQSEEFLLNQIQKTNKQNVQTSYFAENEDNYEVKNIKWPSIKEFTENLGCAKIEEFMRTTWEYDECWLFCVDFIGKEEKEFTTLYNFRARWSIPTRRKPIPHATASVYFTCDVSKIKPKEFEIDVTYIFETQKLVHKPGKSRFRQQWLQDIINLKESLLQGCEF